MLGVKPTYNVPQDLRAKAQIIHGVNFSDFIIVLAVGVFGYFLSDTFGLIADKLVVPFNIFNIMVIIFLIMPSQWNKGKKNYQSLMYALVNDKYSYHTKSYPYHSSESCLDTPILDQEIHLVAHQAHVDIDAIRKQDEEERLQGLK